MTPPSFQLDDEVEAVETGRRFKISQIWKNGDSYMYATEGMCYYPTSSLRLVEELKIGDKVRTVEPEYNGIVFEFNGYDKKNDAILSVTCDPIFIEKIDDDLKIGDWVLCLNSGETAKIIQINKTSPYSIQVDDKSWSRPKTLRKLAPDEIQQRQAPPINTPQNQFNEKTEKRLSAIEKRLEFGAKVTRKLVDGQDAIEKRLAVLEGERPEVIDRDQIRIPENASISMRSDQNGKVAIDYSDEGFELAKAVLDSMREA